MTDSLGNRAIDGMFTVDMARHVADYRIGPAIMARVEILREKASEGQLTDEERAEPIRRLA